MSLLNRIRRALAYPTPEPELPPNRAMTQYEQDQYEQLIKATTKVVETAAAFVRATEECIANVRYIENQRLQAREMNKRIRNQFAWCKGRSNGS